MHNSTSIFSILNKAFYIKLNYQSFHKTCKQVLLLGVLVLSSIQYLYAQEVYDTFDTTGSEAWSVPNGATSVKVEIWGAGGAGGGSRKDNVSGGGGGGGAYISQTYNNVTPGQTFSFTVGIGGTIANNTGDGNNGGDTTLTPPNGTTLSAGGGNGGKAGSGNSNGQAGTGGSATGNNSENGQQGQGGSGQTGGNGGNAARASNTGGAGSSNADGQSGSSPGGGGGGGNGTGNGNSNFRNGGAGANGRVKFTYTLNLTPTITNISPLTVCVGEQVIITGTNLNNASQVRIGNANASSFSINSNTQITATISSGSVGNGNIQITTPEGTTTSNNSLVVNGLNVAPTQISVARPNCANENITLTVSGGTLASNDTQDVKWSKGSCDGPVIHSGLNLGITKLDETTTYFVKYVGACAPSDCISVTLEYANPVGNSIGAISGQQDVCKNSSNITYTVPAVTNAENYTWTLPSGGSPTTGSLITTTNSITVDYVNASSGNVTVVANGVGDCGGNTNQSSLAITVEDVPSAPSFVNPVSNICYGGTKTYTVTAIPGATSYNWTLPTDAIITSGDGTNTITVDFNTAINGAITVAAENGCGTGDTTTLPLSFNTVPDNPEPITGPTLLCPGETMVEYTIPSLPNTTSYNWTISNSSASFNGTSNTNAIALDIANAALNDFTISVVGVNNCGESVLASELLVNVNEKSTAPTTITSSNSNTICEGIPTTLGITGGSQGTGASLEWYTDTALTNSAGSGETITVTPSATTTYYVRYEGTCNNTSVISQIITVNEESTQPTTITSTSGDTFCEGTQTTLGITGGSQGTGASLEWYTDAALTNSAGSGETITVTLSETTTYYVRYEGTCNDTSVISQIITVNEESTQPTTITSTSGDTFCEGTQTTLGITGGSQGTGATLEWYTDAALTNSAGSGETITVTPSETTTYYVRYEGTCNDTSVISQVITVNKESTQPTTISSSNGDTFCEGTTSSTLTVTGGSLGTEASIEWYTDTSFNTNVGSGTTINIAPTESTTYYVRHEGLCNTTGAISQTITVNPLPIISVNQPSQTICSDGSIAPITILNENSVTGISYAWTRTNTSNLTGIATSGSGSPISGTLKNTTGTPQITTFTITATANGCTSETTATVTVNPKPELSATFTPEICSGETTDITISDDQGVDKPLTYVWTRNNTSDVTGPATGDSNTINVALTNSTNSPQTTTFTVRANSEYGCLSESFTVDVIVNPAPTVAATNTLQEICFGEAITPIVISNPNGIAGVSYSWTRNNTTGITGLESGTSAPNAIDPTISGTLVNTTNSPQTTTFTIIASANGCDSELTTATITVNPELVISINPDLRPNLNQTVCSGTKMTPIEILNDNNLENVEYYWERTDNFSTVTGLESGNGASISGQFESTDFRNRVLTFKVWAVANGCESNVIEDIRVRVTPTPIVEVSPSTQAICDGGTFSMAFSNTYNTNNTNYSWEITNLPAGVTSSNSSGTGPTASGTLTNTTTETQTVTFTITATRQGCSTTTTATVDVYAPLTNPVIGNSQDVCYGEDPTPLYLETAISGGSGNYSYEWQVSQNQDSGFTTVGTGTTYAPPRQERYYRLRVYDNACSSTIKISNIIIINYSGLGGVFDSPEVTNKPSTTIPYCPGDEINPKVTIGHTWLSDVDYSWSSNASYFTPATGTDNGKRVNTSLLGRETSATINATLKNDGNSTVSTIFYITPIFSNYTTCNSDLIELPLMIYPTPKIESVTAAETEICSGSTAEIIVDGNITDNPMEFSWEWETKNSADNGLIEGIESSTSGEISENDVFELINELTNTSDRPITVVYTFTPISTTCDNLTGLEKHIEITVLPFIEAEANLITTIDENTPCDVTTVTLEANTNISGEWTAIPLGGVFSDITDPNATFTGESGTDYTLTWTVSNGEDCGESSAEVAVNIPACSGNNFDFNGTNTSVNFGNTYNLNGPFSIEIWVKPNSTNGSQTLFSKRSITNSTSGYDLTINNGTSIAFNWGNNNNISATGLSTSRWYHIAVTYNGSGYKLYIDGILKASKTGDGPQSNTSLALLGAIQDSVLPSNYFNGWLDELRIWNTALSADQIREMMNQEIENNGGTVRGSVIPLDINGGLNWNTNLVGYYQMGSKIIDGILTSTKGTATGVLRNMTTMQQETAPLPYVSGGNSDWNTAAAWNNADVNLLPNSNDITWNIVKIKNNVSIDKSTTVLGLIVEDNTLTVSDNMPLNVTKYLKLDGTLKLENEAQLLQPKGSIVDYNGTGGLLRDQEGTTNVYNYNYWASPVSTAGTENNRTYKLSEVLHVGTTPVGWTANHNGAAGNPPSISTRWLYLFENYNTDTFNWHRIDEDYIINVGLGYIMKGATKADYTFIGQPNNGDYKVNVSSGNDALVGNPYPSAIDANTFINDNRNMLDDGGNNGEIRFWRQSTTNNSHVTKEYLGGYASLNLTGGTAAVAPADISGTGDATNYIPKRYIPVAQGFFITAGQTGQIEFNNSQRIFKTEASGDSAFLRANGTIEESTNDVQRVRLAFKNPDNAIRQLLLGFTPDNAATDDVDFGYDATNFEELSSDMLFLINEKTYVIQGVGEFDETKQYPLAMFIGKDGNVEISLKGLENFDNAIDVFIYDSFTDTYTKINDSKFSAQLSKGEYLDRYFVAFNDENKLDIIEKELDSIEISYLNQTDEISIKTPAYTTIKQVYLINVLGQTVKMWNTTNAPLSNDCKIPVRNISEGNYIIKVETQNGSKIKKVSIKY
ncbi:hypothetical protein BN863_11390 [Formosa agariphila KMM 3901]|uniref:LamG-like jellyroll fold domain-containing protein n=1 Tax=Formosa agariphila (strain DSM 15362 / KCTC 12365 / LMG 23005 / KMM 3901 / M-2Alg 35-1) TaxID=1347342 RepID=T2KKB5_FORAG|nr:LamG-like jellyroll fold domain-containing protein [Formosa agariphila]CDF78851.1 hypothetical protein BN863_11390 [Formosa agariphila KMM 3901]